MHENQCSCHPSLPPTNTHTITQGNWNKHEESIVEDGNRTVEVKKAIDQTMHLNCQDENFLSLSFQKQPMFAPLCGTAAVMKLSYVHYPSLTALRACRLDRSRKQDKHKVNLYTSQHTTEDKHLRFFFLLFLVYIVMHQSSNLSVSADSVTKR